MGEMGAEHENRTTEANQAVPMVQCVSELPRKVSMILRRIFQSGTIDHAPIEVVCDTRRTRCKVDSRVRAVCLHPFLCLPVRQ